MTILADSIETLVEAVDNLEITVEGTDGSEEFYTEGTDGSSGPHSTSSTRATRIPAVLETCSGCSPTLKPSRDPSSTFPSSIPRRSL